MRRRDFIAGVLLAASAMIPKRATLARDRPKIPRVGYLLRSAVSASKQYDPDRLLH
jgi:hypothetical protein